MSPARRRAPEPLTDAERARLEEQTRRNLDALEHEAAGRIDQAVQLYEQNVAEGFEGEWPYIHLAAIYERAGQYAEAERVLDRAIEVTRASQRRPAADRRAILEGLRGRLRSLKQTKRAHASRRATPKKSGGSFVPLPILDNS